MVGGWRPAGICGSGLVDLIAELLRRGHITPPGEILSSEGGLGIAEVPGQPLLGGGQLPEAVHVALEQVLVRVGEDVELPVVLVLQHRLEAIVPEFREVLALVDDDRVDLLLGGLVDFFSRN